MHSSRMRTGRSLTIFQSLLLPGVGWGVYLVPGVGVYLVQGVYLVLGVSLVLGVYLVPWGCT